MGSGTQRNDAASAISPTDSMTKRRTYLDAKSDSRQSTGYAVLFDDPVDRIANDTNRTIMPTDPCWRCEARGWCRHRQPG